MSTLLSAWRKTPATELAAALTRELRAAGVNAAPKDHAGWTKRAKVVRAEDLPELGALLASIRSRKLSEVAERARALSRLGADPRVAEALGDLVREVPFTSNSSAGTWDSILEALVAAQDPRAIAWLSETRAKVQPLRDGFRKIIEPRLDGALEQLRKAFPEGAPPLSKLDEATRSALVAVPAPVEKPKAPRDLESLLADVYAHPFDDAPRLVLADWLQEKGDPRGEFITLQCLKKGDPEAEKKAAALLRKHGKAWIGELAPFAFEYAFARGFPVKLTLKARNELEAKKTDAVAAFATIEELDLRRAVGHLPRAARALRWVAVGTEDAMAEVGAAAFEHLEAFVIGNLRHEDEWRRFQRSPSAKRLRRLGGVPCEWLDEAMLSQLEEVTLAEEWDVPLHASALSAVHRHPQLTVIAHGHTHRTTTRNVNGEVAVRLELTLGERDAAWTNQRPVDIEHSTRRRDEALAVAFETELGRTLIRSLEVSCVLRDPKLVVPSVQAESKARLLSAIDSWAKHAEALVHLDLRALGGAVIERTDAAPARDVPVIPPIGYAAPLRLTDDRLFVIVQQRTLAFDPTTLALQTMLPAASRVTPDGRTLVHVSGSLYLTDTQRGTTRVVHGGSHATAIELSRDASRVLLLHGDIYMDRQLEVLAIDGEDGTAARVLFQRKAVDNGGLSPDGKLVAIGRSEKLSLFTVDEPKAAGVVLAEIDVDNYTPVTFSPSGRTLVVQDSNHALHAFDVETRTLRAEIPLASRGTHACNDDVIVAAGDEGLFAIDLRTAEKRTLTATPTRSVALSPDGRRVAARIDHALVVLGIDGVEISRLVCRD